MRMHVILGPPGAGKSTHVAENAKAGDAVVDFDAMALAMGSTVEHDAPPTVSKLVFAARQAAIARAFDSMTGEKEPLPADVWAIAYTLPADTIADWESKGAVFTVIDPGKETVLERLTAEQRPQSSFDAAEAWYANPPKTAAKEAVMPKVKSAPIDVDSSLEEGMFTGYASVFDNKDSYGDIVRRGAFADTLAEYGEKGEGIPCYWGHRMDDPHMNIGATVEAVEDERGLKVTVQLDLDSAAGAQVHRLIKQGRVRQMSFAYDVLEAGWVDSEEDGGFYELRKLKIHEVSVVPVGANQETELLAVKMGQLIETTPETGQGEQGKAEEPKVEEPETAKTSEAKAAHARASITFAELGLG